MPHQAPGGYKGHTDEIAASLDGTRGLGLQLQPSGGNPPVCRVLSGITRGEEQKQPSEEANMLRMELLLSLPCPQHSSHTPFLGSDTACASLL